MTAMPRVGTVAAHLPNCPKCESRMVQGPRPFRRMFGDIRAFECSACGHILFLKHPYEAMVDQAIGSMPVDPVAFGPLQGASTRTRSGARFGPPIPSRYLLGILLAAVLAAAALRHVLHVQAGLTRIEIFDGALAAATIGVFLAVVFFRRRRRP
jgi:hypothetical protein